MDPHPLDATNLGLQVVKFLPGASSLGEMLRQKFSADARMRSEVDAMHDDWWGRLLQLLAERSRKADPEEWAAAWDRVTGDTAAGMLLANYVEDAYREPLRERREMLEHAVAGLFDMGLTLDELVQAWRIVRAFGPRDVLTLHGMWLATNRTVPDPTNDGFGRNSPRSVRARFGKTLSIDALRASPCIEIRDVGEGFGSGGTHEELEITKTGELVLSALRSFLATRQVPFLIPGHETTDRFRSEDDARRVLDAVSFLGNLRKYQNRRFTRLLTYDAPNIARGAPADGRAQLVFRRVTTEDCSGLPAPERQDVALGTSVGDVWIGSVSRQDPGFEVQLFGPHDVLRFLAYDLHAAWS
jgi:hypothetical protein